MGAGILPATIWKGELWFLFGKEGKYEDSAHGFSDFGGGTDSRESFLETAVREAGEELTGFLGTDGDVRRWLRRCGHFPIDHQSDGFPPYRMHIVPCDYNPWLPHFYNQNQQFLQKRMPAAWFKQSKIFEKAEIRWVPSYALGRMRPQFRNYFRHIVDDMLARMPAIHRFVRQQLRRRRGDTITSRPKLTRTETQRRKEYRLLHPHRSSQGSSGSSTTKVGSRSRSGHHHHHARGDSATLSAKQHLSPSLSRHRQQHHHATRKHSTRPLPPSQSLSRRRRGRRTHTTSYPHPPPPPTPPMAPVPPIAAAPAP